MLEELIALGEKLPGTTSDLKWDHHICLNVKDKMYLITTPDAIPINASFKVDPEDVTEYVAREGVRVAPYLGRYHWVEVDDINRFSLEEWREILKNSHRLVAQKLPKKFHKELGL